MGYFQVRYDSRIVIYDRITFIRLITVLLQMLYNCVSFTKHCQNFVLTNELKYNIPLGRSIPPNLLTRLDPFSPPF